MRKIRFREYKVMLDHRAFVDRKRGVASFWEELRDFVRAQGHGAEGKFAAPEKRTILFLDTKDLSLSRNQVIFRRRESEDKRTIEYTLKCRSEDRYIANGIDLRATKGLEEDDKFEEDIATPFRSRFSHSNSVRFDAGDHRGAPVNLGEAGLLFPYLSTLRHDGIRCPGDTPLGPVNSVSAFERVYKGPKFRFGDKDATAAIILWSQGENGRPLVAEFSFRYGSKHEAYPPAVAEAAKGFFEALQHVDWCRPDGLTKTQYVYRGV